MKREFFDAHIAPWLRLLHTPGVGSAGAAVLLREFGAPERIFAQPADALAHWLGAAKARAVLSPPPDWPAVADKAFAWLDGGADEPFGAAPAGRAIWTLRDDFYPPALREIADPPPVLYVLGHPQWLDAGEPPWHQQALGALAVVGSRAPTRQGLENARQMAEHLQKMGVTIASGLALGIDAAAHEGALRGPAGLGPATIAVLGTGIDRIYPRQNAALAQAIARQGLVFSEQPLGAVPQAHHFPRRNRIITGLAQGTLVVEAALKSGSLISARLAAEQGREVFAIPGSIHSAQAQGCNALIKQGAKLVAHAQDILDELPQIAARAAALQRQHAGALAQTPAAGRRDVSALVDAASSAARSGQAGNNGAAQIRPSSAAENPVLDALGADPVSLDALEARTGLPTARLQAQLLELELLGLVERLPGGLYQRLFQA